MLSQSEDLPFPPPSLVMFHCTLRSVHGVETCDLVTHILPVLPTNHVTLDPFSWVLFILCEGALSPHMVASR